MSSINPNDSQLVQLVEENGRLRKRVEELKNQYAIASEAVEVLKKNKSSDGSYALKEEHKCSLHLSEESYGPH